MIGLQTKIVNFLSSRLFFYLILGFFVIESVWIAVSAAYPMVFDENTHFFVIQVYSHQWGPFLPPHSTYIDATGAVVRDPSFLYHYLMSFPYRLIKLFTANQTAQIILLRLINIALFGGGLVLFRKLLLKTKARPSIVHASLLFFILVPVVPLVAGEINYDNLLMVLTPAALLLTISITDRLKRGDVPVASILWLLVLCMLTSLVQVEFLPIFLAIVLWLGWAFFRNKKVGLAPILRSVLTMSWTRRVITGIALAVSLYLFLSMIGVNLVRYHTVTPGCTQVLTTYQCGADANWVREQQALAYPVPIDHNPVIFAGSWLYRMFVAMFYTSSGGASPQAYYLSVNPLPIIFITALVVFLGGALLFIRYASALLRQYKHLGFLLFVSVFYVLILIGHNYLDFLHYHQKFAIQGRYIFPVALPIILLVALSYRQLLKNRARSQLVLLAVVFLLFLQGGGALTYITYSNEYWYWHGSLPKGINSAAQKVIRPLIIDKKPIPSVRI